VIHSVFVGGEVLKSGRRGWEYAAAQVTQ